MTVYNDCDVTTGVNWRNGVIFRACAGWYKGNVANKSHGLSIRVTRVNCLYFGSLCLRFELRSQVYCCHWFEVNKYWGLQNAIAIAIAKIERKSPGNSENLKKLIEWLHRMWLVLHSSFFYKHSWFCLSLAMLNFSAIWASKNAQLMLKFLSIKYDF